MYSLVLKRTISVSEFRDWLMSDQAATAREVLSALAVEPSRWRDLEEIIELLRYNGLVVLDDGRRLVHQCLDDFLIMGAAVRMLGRSLDDSLYVPVRPHYSISAAGRRLLNELAAANLVSRPSGS